ncbi:hypothetical protein [Streptomyces sp. 150FB]|uniref:hypothetical protein n=1 Tax=Streptomyces sp. 150FB TaxID=1576605 RepID=UPI000695AFE3|nr:hypothetical protein [Streptomyces sp. 150FB]
MVSDEKRRRPGAGTDENGADESGADTSAGAVSEALRRIRARLADLPEGEGNRYWLRSESDDERFAYISANKQLIVAAAEHCGLSPEMLAGIAWQEIGGAPRVVDDIAYEVRKVLPGSDDPDKTSMGPLAVQVRRAAEVLGYDPGNLAGEQRRAVVEAVREPRQNIFIAAAYLAHEKAATEYADVPPERMTRAQMRDLAARYNGGPYYRVEAAQAYARAFAGNVDRAVEALR